MTDSFLWNAKTDSKIRKLTPHRSAMVVRSPHRPRVSWSVLLQERTALWTKERQLREEKLLLLRPGPDPPHRPLRWRGGRGGGRAVWGGVEGIPAALFLGEYYLAF